jgi:thiamine pyrophosphate-dependent acetolactate synthase large subunit-like protein
MATESAMPLVVLGGSTHGPTRGLGGFQEADQVAFANPGCKWTRSIDSTERIPELVHLALGKAAAGRPGAVYLDFLNIVAARGRSARAARKRLRSPCCTRTAAIERITSSRARGSASADRQGRGVAAADAALADFADLAFYVTRRWRAARFPTTPLFTEQRGAPPRSRARTRS